MNLRHINKDELAPLRPFLSVFLIVISMFVVVFAKMEERRIGYIVLKLTHEQRKAIEEKRAKIFQLAKLIRPEHVEKVAQDRFTLKKVQTKQIIHLSGSTVNSPTAEIRAKEF